MILSRSFRRAVVCGLAVVLWSSCLLASTGRPHEISNIHFENATQTTVDVVWTTAHPSTSQVLISYTNDFEADRWALPVADPALVTTHRVTVDHLIPFNPKTGDGTYYIYVASVDAKGEMSTAPGPQTQDGKNPSITMRTAPAAPMGPPSMKFYTSGPDETFPGYDMYFQVQPIIMAGPTGTHIYIHNERGYNNSSDGVVKYLGADKGNPETISVHFSCEWGSSTGQDSEEQQLDRDRNMGYCSGANANVRDLTIRLRTLPNTVPGKYSVAFTLESNGQVQTGTYEFTVQPAPTAPPHPQLTPKPIPGLSTWEKQMFDLGKKWCIYRDEQNAAGNFVDNWGWTGDAWFYDGGRVYQNIDTYTAAAGHPLHAAWQHCALTLLDPYANYLVANNGNMAGYSIFPYGMAMNFYRTKAEVMRNGIKAVATLGPQRQSCGYVDPGGIRENSYRSNAWMANEMLGAPRWPLLQRNIDKVMGNLNMANRGLAGSVHPFMLGIGMETLIHWYDLNLAEGHPDYRVLPVIKETLDAMWRDLWVPKQNILVYERYTLPPNHSISYGALNNLVSVAYAWYWMQTGDTVERDHGDLLFQHAFDDPEGGYSWSGKQFSQEFEFSFDFVRYRQGLTTSSVVQENNPYTGPYADTNPPISEKVNCDPNYFPNCKAGTIGSTTATIFWGTYKPATTQLIYGKTDSYGQVSPIDKAMVYSHVVKLTGLEPGTTYHFRTRSVDRAGYVGSMKDLTFTTLPAQPGAKTQ
jgi:hypothetical protein